MCMIRDPLTVPQLKAMPNPPVVGLVTFNRRAQYRALLAQMAPVFTTGTRVWVDLANSDFKPVDLAVPAGMCTAMGGSPVEFTLEPCTTPLPALIEGECPVGAVSAPPPPPPPGAPCIASIGTAQLSPQLMEWCLKKPHVLLSFT